MTTTTIRAEWLQRLRSGDYPQGKVFLKTERDDGKTCYCPLGVLGEVFVERGMAKWIPSGGGSYLLGAGDYQYESVLPDPLANMLAEATHGTLFSLESQVWEMNDYYDASFLKIADYIEAHCNEIEGQP